jgi:hypothetical protein
MVTLDYEPPKAPKRLYPLVAGYWAGLIAGILIGSLAVMLLTGDVKELRYLPPALAIMAMEALVPAAYFGLILVYCAHDRRRQPRRWAVLAAFAVGILAGFFAASQGEIIFVFATATISPIYLTIPATDNGSNSPADKFELERSDRSHEDGDGHVGDA